MLNQQKLQKIYKEEVSIELKLRAQAAKQLTLARNQLRIEKDAAKHAAVEATMIQWEEEVKRRSEVIARKQGYLTDQKDVTSIDTLCTNSKDYQVCIHIYIHCQPLYINC